MQFYRAETIDRLDLSVGAIVMLESLRQAVIPPYLMLMPFIEVPESVTVLAQHAPDEEGSHGCVFQLRATDACVGEIAVGFRDLRTDEVTHRKVIPITVS
jgi:hypothetical protein